VPDEEIGIKVIGVRPGEKLSEELVGADEEAASSSTEGILQVKALRSPRLARLRDQIDEIERLARGGDRPGVLRMLQTIVPTYRRALEGFDQG